MIALLALWLAQDPLQPVKIPLPDASRHGAAFSPDGEWVYYFEETPKPDRFSKHARHASLFRTTLDGKAEKVVDVGNVVGEIHWHPDGKRFAVVRAVGDTNGDGKVDSRDGDSLWMDGKDVIPAQKKKMHFYGWVADDRMVLGYRDSYERTARIVIRDADGKEQELVEAHGLVLANAQTALGRSVTRGFDEHDHETKSAAWTLFAVGARTKGAALEGKSVLGEPVVAEDRIYYARVVDDHDRKTALVVCGRDGKGARDLTKGEETIVPVFGFAAGVFCVVPRGAGTEFVLVTEAGERKSLWMSGPRAHSPCVSPDGKRISFVLGTGDLHVAEVAYPAADAGAIDAAKQRVANRDHAEAASALSELLGKTADPAARRQIRALIEESDKLAREDWEKLQTEVAALPKDQAIPKLEAARKTFAGHAGIVAEIESRLGELRK
jgi:hypothetical protein